MPTQYPSFPIWRKEFWSAPAYFNTVGKLHEAELAREAAFQRDINEFNQSAQTRREIDVAREQAALNEKNAQEAHERELFRRKADEELERETMNLTRQQARERAYKGITQFEREKLGQPQGGFRLPEAVIGAMAEQRAEQALQKAEAFPYLRDLMSSTATVAGIPLTAGLTQARAVNETGKLAEEEMRRRSLIEDELAAERAGLRSKVAVGNLVEKQPMLGVPTAFSANLRAEQDAAEQAAKDRRAAAQLKIPLEEYMQKYGSGRLGDRPQTRSSAAPSVIDFNKPIDVRYGGSISNSPPPADNAPQPPPANVVSYEDILAEMLRPSDPFSRLRGR